MPRASRELVAIALLAGAACGEPIAEDIRPEASVEPGGVSPVASLTRAEGDVRVQAAGAVHWASARVGRGLAAADSVQTMRDGHATLTFGETGARTELGPHTTMVIPEQAPRTTRLRHLSGQLFARLDADGGADRLQVTIPAGELVLDPPAAGDAYVEARVEITDAHAEVAMVAGRGRLERADQATIALEEAQYVRVDREAHVVETGADVAPPETLLRPRGDEVVVTRGAVSLAWTPVEGARGYLVEVTREGGERVEHRASGPRLQLRASTGAYRWTVRAVTDRGPGHVSEPERFRVQVDRSPPPLSLVAPPPSSTVRESTVRVQGRAEAGASVDVNGQPATVDDDGAFTARVALPLGLTNLVIVASDAAGNRRSLARSVLRSR